MKNFKFFPILFVAILLVCYENEGENEEITSQSVYDSECKNGASPSDLDLWSTHNCSWEFVEWQSNAYRMKGWEDWGSQDACNLDRPYAKAVNASYLITYGLSDNFQQWHGTIDYRQAAEALSSSVHNQIHYSPTSNRNWLAYAEFGRYPEEDRTLLGCLLFDFGETHNNPATRAGDYIHEGWHHWQYKYGYDPSHDNGPIDNCTMNGRACDWYYPHSVGQYEVGQIWRHTSDDEFFHSPNQVQVEFLCDLAEFAAEFVPTSVKELAQAEANSRLSTRFRNAVGYRCGDPRPW